MPSKEGKTRLGFFHGVAGMRLVYLKGRKETIPRRIQIAAGGSYRTTGTIIPRSGSSFFHADYRNTICARPIHATTRAFSLRPSQIAKKLEFLSSMNELTANARLTVKFVSMPLKR